MPGATPTFVVNTGRCGSTFLSEILNQHPRVLSLSEFFVSMEPEPFPAGAVSGDQLAAKLARKDPLASIALISHAEPAEFRYPIDAGLRYDRASGVPAVAAIALPHLTDDPDTGLDDLIAMASGLPSAPIEQQYLALFDWLCDRFGGDMWVERSGGSIQYVPELMDRFPGARFIHLYRDGRETAISMSSRPNFRVMFVGADIERLTGVNPFTKLDPPPLPDLPEPYARLVPPNFEFQKLLDYPIPLERFGLHWSSSIFRGLRSLRGVDPAQILPMSYEDLVTDPATSLDRLARFMEIDVPDRWIAGAEAAAKRPPSKWAQLPEPERSRLDAACRIANRRLYGPAGPPA
jgi:hypothetical protein